MGRTLNTAKDTAGTKTADVKSKAPSEGLGANEAGPKKQLPEYRCFLCGEEHETDKHTPGHIEFDDGDIRRKIYVCHYCAAQSMEDLLNKACEEARQQVMGELMYKRALESRSW